MITLEYVEALAAYSKMLLMGGMAPKEVSRWEGVAAIIEVGRDLGLPDSTALNTVKIVNGRPSIYGDAGMALIRASGLLEESYPKERYEGVEDTDGYTAIFTIKRVGQGEERTERFSVADAKKAKLWKQAGPWTEYPKRMLMARARGFATRDEFQDVLCGLIFFEEAQDLPPELPRQADAVKIERIVPEALPANIPATEGTFVPGEVTGPTDPSSTGQQTAGADDRPHPREVPASREDRMQLLAELRGELATKHTLDSLGIQAAWANRLNAFGVKSAKELDDAKLLAFIQSLLLEIVPF